MRINRDRFYLEVSSGHKPMFHVSKGRTSTGAFTLLVRVWHWLFQIAAARNIR
jgi:hypothetical protein